MKSIHHTFDIDLAAEYGIQEAILIHHFQLWIRHNKSLKRNLIEGKTWSYQTLEEITAHFPYIGKDRIAEVIDRLCTGRSRRSKNQKKEFEPVLLKRNFNKSKYDRTTWYAFVNEEKFSILSIDKMDLVEYQNGSRRVTAPIPCIKPYIDNTPPTPKPPDETGALSPAAKSSSPIPTPSGNTNTNTASGGQGNSKPVTPPTPAAMQLARDIIEKLKSDPTYTPVVPGVIAKELDILLTKNSNVLVLEIIDWALTHHIWGPCLYKDRNVGSWLKKKFTQLHSAMQFDKNKAQQCKVEKPILSEKELIKRNLIVAEEFYIKSKNYAVNVKFFPEEFILEEYTLYYDDPEFARKLSDAGHRYKINK